MNTGRALFKNMYGKRIPCLSCFVTNVPVNHKIIDPYPPPPARCETLGVPNHG